MWLLRAFAERLLSCVLALLAALQPALAGHCFCPCQQDCTSCCAAECSCDCEEHCSHCESECHQCTSGEPCEGDRTTEDFSTSWFRILHPCECPADCDCHLRHSQPLSSAPNAGPRIDKQLSETSDAWVPDWPKGSDSSTAGLNRPDCGIHLALDAPASCAVLCRFTI
jgi:hypothetical protein